MTRMAILLPEGVEAHHDLLTRILGPSGMGIESVLTASEMRELLDGLGEDLSAVGVFVRLEEWREPPLCVPEPASLSEAEGPLPIKTLVVEMLTHQLVNIIKGEEAYTAALKDMLTLEGYGPGHPLMDKVSLLHDSVEGHLRLLQVASDTVLADHQQGPCSLAEAAEQAGRLFAHEFDYNGIQFEVKIGQDISLNIPLQVIILVLCKLVGNAKDATGQGGSIRIEAEDADDYIKCHVVDNGHGIEPGMIESIWEVGQTTKSGHNKGHGLPLARRALDERGAFIELTSTRPGETTFTIYFPKLKESGHNG